MQIKEICFVIKSLKSLQLCEWNELCIFIILSSFLVNSVTQSPSLAFKSNILSELLRSNQSVRFIKHTWVQSFHHYRLHSDQWNLQFFDLISLLLSHWLNAKDNDGLTVFIDMIAKGTYGLTVLMMVYRNGDKKFRHKLAYAYQKWTQSCKYT